MSITPYAMILNLITFILLLFNLRKVKKTMNKLEGLEELLDKLKK